MLKQGHKKQNTCDLRHPELVSGSDILGYEILKQVQDDEINHGKYDFMNFRKYCHSEYFSNGNIDTKNDFMTLLINNIANGI